MRATLTLFFILIIISTAGATGTDINYTVNGEPYEGYYLRHH